METKDTLRFVVASGNIPRWLIQESVKKIEKTHAVKVELDYCAEQDIPNQELGSIIYTHGGAMEKHKHLEHLLHLHETRPDLRVIVHLEEFHGRDKFTSDECFELYKRLLEKNDAMLRKCDEQLDKFDYENRTPELKAECIKFEVSAPVICSTNDPVPFLSKLSFDYSFGMQNAGPHLDLYIRQYLAQPRVDVVVAYDSWSDFVQEHFSKVLLGRLTTQLGFRFTFDWKQEDVLEKPEELPQNAVMYTHTSYNSGNTNIDKILALAGQRPDLRFVVRAEPPADKALYDSFASSSASEQRGLCVHASPSAMLGEMTMNGNSYIAFKNYLKHVIGSRRTK